MGLKSKHETRRQNRPVMEALEGRIVLSTFRATTVTQLQADIAAVNNTSGPNTIILKPGVYLMSSELQIQNAGNLTIRPARQARQPAWSVPSSTGSWKSTAAA